MVSTQDPQLSPLAALEPSFPRQPRNSYVPDSLNVPCGDIRRPDDLPRFLLLGERDDTSFELREDGFVVEYVWPALSEGSVVRLTCRDTERIFIEEFWEGASLGTSTGRGPTLAEALSYHVFASLQTARDGKCQTESGELQPHKMDARETFFRQLLWSRLSLTYLLPEHGQSHAVDLPGGFARALVIPHRQEEAQQLTDLAHAYCQRVDSYAVAGLPDRLRHGSFSHRITWIGFSFIPEASRPEYYGECLCRIFVGPWRAVVELALFMGENGWDFDNKYRRHACVCFPRQLARPFHFRSEGGERRVPVDALHPALLSAQEGSGVEEGLVPPPMGKLDNYRAGGPEHLQHRLRQTVDQAFPVDRGTEMFALPDSPDAPVVWLQRTSNPQRITTPLLFVLMETGSGGTIAHRRRRARGDVAVRPTTVSSPPLLLPVPGARVDVTECPDCGGQSDKLPSPRWQSLIHLRSIRPSHPKAIPPFTISLDTIPPTT